jgi:anti-sigma factor RsiW
MNREPVNPDDPQMTAYALGELSAAESAEFEARLQLSPVARRELAEMKEVMKLLAEGLRGEWQTECERPALKLLDPLPAGGVVVPVDFRPRARRAIAAAAGIAALILSGAAVFNVPRPFSGPEGGFAAADAVGADVRPTLAAASRHVPQLFLAEEVEDLSSLNLVGEGTLPHLPVDATYLEADAVIPASFHPSHGASRHDSTLRSAGFDRVDSYLPPLDEESRHRGSTTLIERRLGRGDGGGANGSDRVLVSGYVTMGGGEMAPRLAGGFRPVSISGNPVVNEESDLRLLADLNGLQKELSEVIAEMPEDSEDRVSLERILERSERVVSRLKAEMAR